MHIAELSFDADSVLCITALFDGLIEADVQLDMTARFEQEVDTTHANDLWQQEAAENKAAKAGSTAV